MKKDVSGVLLIILAVVLFCSPVKAFPGSNEGIPIRYQCAKSNEAEAAVCTELYAALERTGLVNLSPNPNDPYFMLVVLPTERDGYLSVAIQSSFPARSLDGLSLSAYFAGFIVVPGGWDAESADTVAGYVLKGTAEWIIRTQDLLYGDNDGIKIPQLETS